MQYMQAAITSVGSSLLKLDSTEKVCHKLQGVAAGAAKWLTNVSNERGQLLNSVLTVSEDHESLRPLAVGLVNRYNKAGWPMSQILYVDRDCCSRGVDRPSRFQVLFKEWHGLKVRLDVWHFMRRLGRGCASEQHPLFGVFMSRLSSCIFEVDAEDYALLCKAKRAQMSAQGAFLAEGAEMKLLTKDELQLHCRRRTRGAVTTKLMVNELIRSLHDKTSILGEVLFADIDKCWEEERRHLLCLQDPPGVALYTRTGSLNKGTAQHTYSVHSYIAMIC